MKYSIKILLAAFTLAVAFLTSCLEDKGNYEYNHVRKLDISIGQDSIIIMSGEVLTIEPVFIDTETGDTVNVNYDDYSYEWHSLENNSIYTSSRKLLSEKYNLDESIMLPVLPDYHSIFLTAINRETGQVYDSRLFVRVIGAFASTYAFLTEDAAGNVELEFYGRDGSGNVKRLKNHLAAVDYPHVSGGANAIVYDNFMNRLYIATGSRTAWLNSPDFTFDPKTNDIKEWLIPTSTETFTEMIRLGEADGHVMRTFFCFTKEGELNVVTNSGIQPNIGLRNFVPVKVSPIVAGYTTQTAVLLWDDTNKEVTWVSMLSIGMSSISRSLNLYRTGISAALSECPFMGGSMRYEMIAVLKDVNGTYWRIDAQPQFSSIHYVPISIREPKELVGTADLGVVDHWFNSSENGFLYAIVGNSLYSYIESQAGGVADQGWIPVNIRDTWGAPVTIADPISFVWRANNGNGDMQTCFYIVTYSAAKGSTVYRLNPGDSGSEVVLLEKIEGLGNVKKMCFWWG